MKYKIIDIEGIGEVYAEKFQKIGIETTDDLLEAGLTEAGRDILAQKTGIPASLIYKFTNQADLFRVSGVGSEFAELLEESGIESVGQLAKQEVKPLEEKLRVTNERRKLTRRLPSESELEKMIEDAAVVEPVLSY